MQDICFNCKSNDTTMLYGYAVCKSCASKLLHHKDDTIKKWIDDFKPTKEHTTFAEDIQARLDFIEKDYIKKKIKLLNIQDRLEHLQ